MSGINGEINGGIKFGLNNQDILMNRSSAAFSYPVMLSFLLLGLQLL